MAGRTRLPRSAPVLGRSKLAIFKPWNISQSPVHPRLLRPGRPHSANAEIPLRNSGLGHCALCSGGGLRFVAFKIELSPVSFRGKLCAPMQQVNLGMIGGGTVGSGVFHALAAQRRPHGLAPRRQSRLPQNRGQGVRRTAPVSHPAIADDDRLAGSRQRPGSPHRHRTRRRHDHRQEIILAALKLGKPVVTANKALLSAHGEELFAAAEKYGANLYYEASVCGGIPIIKSLREGFVGNRITALYGIVNGTCNYILTRMKARGRGLRRRARRRAKAWLRRNAAGPGH